MEIHKVAHCRVRKGLGPAWADKYVTVFFDDVDVEMSESAINDMVTADVKLQLYKAGNKVFTIEEINNC